MDSFKRKTPEEILLSISKLHQGKLKIYIGAVSGVGKTYHMLREGQHLKQHGIDVVICAVSTMSRPETIEQLGDIERVPSIHWTKGDVLQKDLNLDGLLERNPEVVLVDGLAHRNRKEAKFPTRLEDIKFLLARGISVITTLNVYELESIKEAARKLTGIYVEETVPSDTLELADEVRLIDVTPEKILDRLSEGVLNKNQGRSVYQIGNIGKLRELALRLVAEDVNDSLKKYQEENGLIDAPQAAERILVSAQYHWNGSIHILRGYQIAKRLNGDLYVVNFARPHAELSKEEASFKRSILKLIKKIEASFEEVPITHKRKLPEVLLNYAKHHHVTRIVLGQSRQSRWQEIWQGSIVNRILRKAKLVDLYVVADRARSNGERILPVRHTRTKQPEDAYRRLTHKQVEENISKMKRGQLKVYIGAAPGVGKTYAMLREGNDLLKKGIDVMIGLLETHERAETTEQIGALKLIPRAQILYHGTKLEDMDVQAIIERNPEVVLVDELAHTNVPGSTNKKRYEDIIELLNAGISVVSTMNVQHLESLNDAVEQITGVRVRETVPDHVLRLADEAQLIDVSPNSLQQRMKEGKIYSADKIDQALNHFFRTGNLIALRELSLREIADDVDERLEAWERDSSLRGPWRRKETIFVGVTLGANSERLIRHGFRIAYRLKADWHVNYIHTGEPLSDEKRKRADLLQQLTVRLGGAFEIIEAGSRKSIGRIMLDQANRYESTQMIIGQSNHSFRDKWSPNTVERTILRYGRHMDILLIH
ncbi:histidine kinase [Paenibacillus albiflavus]|uniref:Histidine kinase n=1 Tax=Paenibacillus albiflavus TaxID=2545760 RepID=A0A4R4ENB2_9BACL|nr:histidine kinase [Paenibacillus albiflavus]TCZ80910.1 histidine kinase [Paenibacillus albiflavus]